MWIPHTIPKSTINLFTPLEIIMSRPYDGTRDIKSEDFSWAEHMPKPLKLRCVESISVNFKLYPRNLFEQISPMNAVYLVETLVTNLPIPLVIHVPDSEYWRRRISDSWPANSVEMPGDPATDYGFRDYYLTKYVSEMIENLEPGYVDEETLSELLMACSPHITTLDCKHLRTQDSLMYKLLLEESEELPSDPIHVNMSFVLRHLNNIMTLKLVYCSNTTILSELDSCKLHIDDMDILGSGIVSLKQLTSLTIAESDLNLAKFNRLLPYLMECHELEEIHFSHCKLSSTGAKSVAHYVKKANMLKVVNLCDNDIGPDGVESLAFVTLWRRNNGYPPIELNLNKNNVGDMGASYLASGLASNTNPFTKLSVRSCNITKIGGLQIVQSLTYDRGLHTLEIDNNQLSLEVIIALHEMFKTNFIISKLSIHNCNFPQKMSNFLRRVAFHNRYHKRSEFTYINIEDLYDNIEEKETSEVIKQ